MLYHRVTPHPPTPAPAPALTGSFSQKSWNSMWLIAVSCAMKSFIQHTEERCHSFPRWSWRLFESLLYLVGTMGSFRGPAASRFSCIFLILTKRTTRCGLSCLSRWLEHTLWSGGANTRKGLIWCLSITGVESVSVSRPRWTSWTDGWEEGTKALECCLIGGDNFYHQAPLGRTTSASISEGFACVSLALPRWLLSSKTRSRNPGSSPVESFAASRQQRTTQCPTSVAQTPSVPGLWVHTRLQHSAHHFGMSWAFGCCAPLSACLLPHVLCLLRLLGSDLPSLLFIIHFCCRF